MDLTVARAVFIGGLLKTDPDAPDIRRDDANAFVKTLLRSINVCTTTNVKACKSFVVRYILCSVARTAALVKFLVAVVRNCGPESTGRSTEESEGLKDGGAERTISPSYRALHILYILHDIICFATLRTKQDARHAQLLKINESALADLIDLLSSVAQLTVCANAKPTPTSEQTVTKVEALIREWKKYSILTQDEASTLQKDLESAHTSLWEQLLTRLADNEAQAALAEQRMRENATRWLIPKTNHLPHDSAAEWHELPATNGLFQRQMHGYPLRASAFPPGGYSLERGGQYADEDTRKRVERLLDDVKHCFDKYTNPEEVEDIDALGNVVWKAETGRKRRNHWGWSYEGLEKRKREEAESTVRYEQF